MFSNRLTAFSFTVALGLVLLPAGVQATPPLAGDTRAIGLSNEVGAKTGRLYAVAHGRLACWGRND